MRILLVSSTSRRVAGTETYLEDLSQELTTRGVEHALWSESEEPQDRPPIHMAPEVPVWLGCDKESLVATWNPDILMVNGRLQPSFEESLCRRWPTVFFAHNYFGSCISGLKSHRYPSARPCQRTFGPACLALYLPLGCGGKSPVTMFQLYAREQAHQNRLGLYRAVITHSLRMRDEYARHGFPAEKIHVLPFACMPASQLLPLEEAEASQKDWGNGPVRILFAGRMERIKGGAELLEASSRLVARLGRPVCVTMAGGGEMQESWRSLARHARLRTDGFTVEFPGWLSGERLRQEFARQHLFAMPSLWPEPFGKGGMEAACFGCPSVGYDVGGIPDWLAHGQAGYLASWKGDPVHNLTEALYLALSDRNLYLALRRGARLRAEKFTSAAHCDQLLPLLRTLVGR